MFIPLDGVRAELLRQAERNERLAALDHRKAAKSLDLAAGMRLAAEAKGELTFEHLQAMADAVSPFSSLLGPTLDESVAKLRALFAADGPNPAPGAR